MKSNRIIRRSAFSAVILASVVNAAIADDTTGKKPDAKQHPLQEFLRIGESSRKSLAKVDDYTAILRKMEVVRKKAYHHSMYMRFRAKPFSVYLYFAEKHRGRQVLYVEGENDGKLLARDSGLGALAGTISLKPDSPRAMKEGKFPITKIGMANMLDAVLEQWKNELKYPDVKTTSYPNAVLKRSAKRLKLQPMECKVLQSSHAKKRPDVEFFMTRLYIDKKTNLPVRVEQYGFPKKPGDKPPLMAEYTYWNVRTNVGLKDIDFSRDNPRYGL